MNALRNFMPTLTPISNTPSATPRARLDSSGWLLGALALWLLATLGLRPLLLPDEGRYANVAREMLLGNALVPTLNGLPFFHKPPLFYWLDMAAMQVLGTNAFSARIGSMIGAWLMGASMFYSVRHWHGQRVATIALGSLATAPFFFIGAQYANHDMLVAGLITVAVLALVKAVEEPPQVHLGWLAAAAIACALGVLAKGLIGGVLPALVVGPWLLAQGRWRQLLKLLHPVGLLAFAAVAAPWFVVVQLRYPGFFDYFFIEQHFRRFAQSSFNNVQPFWFFIVLFPALMLPWSVWLPQTFKRLWVGHDAYVGLYVWWVLAVVGFFSLPSSKLAGYVLPAVAPCFALLALALAQRRGRLWQSVMGFSALLCVLIVVVFAWQAPKSNRATALALSTRIVPGDRVVMVNDYFYDLPFYAGLTEPVIIATNWADPELPFHDNWRKQMFEAARFDPARGRELLWPVDRLDALVCGNGTVWFVVRPGETHLLTGVSGIARVFGGPNTELWRAAARR